MTHCKFIVVTVVQMGDRLIQFQTAAASGIGTGNKAFGTGEMNTGLEDKTTISFLSEGGTTIINQKNGDGASALG